MLLPPPCVGQPAHHLALKPVHLAACRGLQATHHHPLARPQGSVYALRAYALCAYALRAYAL